MRGASRARLVTVGGLITALVVGCTGTPAPVAPTVDATATPTRVIPLPPTPDTPAQLALVDPTIVSGLTADVSEVLTRGQYTYLSYPEFPGDAAWTEAIKSQLAPKVERFRQLAPRDSEAPYPELSVTWDLIAASPSALGIRLVTTELGPDNTFDGAVETNWWDPKGRRSLGADALIRTDASAEFFRRLTDIAKADPRVDMALFNEELDGEWEAIHSVAFDSDGNLWVEFPTRQVSDADEPFGVSVPGDDLLSDFGKAARAAAVTPSDPGIGPTPTPSAPDSGAPTPVPSAPAAGRPNCARLKCVALTFDDGPVSGTAELLDILARKEVKATFFMVGSNAATKPQLVRRMAAEGHVLGNHTWDHQQLTRLSRAAIRIEIDRTNAQIRKAAGVTPTLLRPPYGATNPTVRGVAADLGMSQILWNVDPLDWKDRNSSTVASRVLAAARPGSIVLSHDIHPTTVKAYARIIDGLRAKGFTLVTVPELLGSRLTPGASFRGR
ncbi:hypothetical protein PROP_01255 [Propionicimonas sp. T2.31MG-18]